jgi:hypothetical protein
MTTLHRLDPIAIDDLSAVDLRHEGPGWGF